MQEDDGCCYRFQVRRRKEEEEGQSKKKMKKERKWTLNLGIKRKRGRMRDGRKEKLGI